MPRRKRTRASPRRNVWKKAEIGRFDSELKTVAFKEGDSIKDLLEKADLALATGESVNDESGKELDTCSKAKEMSYIIVGNYKNG